MFRHWWQLTGEFSYSCTCLWKPASCDNAFLKAKQQLSLWHTLEIQQVSSGLLQWLLLHFLKEPVSPSALLLWKAANPCIPHFPKPFITSFSDWFTNIGLFLLVWWWKMDGINSFPHAILCMRNRFIFPSSWIWIGLVTCFGLLAYYKSVRPPL